MFDRINPSGLVVAGIGFFLTRFTVTIALSQDPMRFYFAGVLPLVVGLTLAAFGVALTVGDVDEHLVQTTAVWCVVGTGSMLILVLLTLEATNDGGQFGTATARAYFANFLIGGSVGGTITGLYAAHNRQQQGRLRQQTNRLEVLNRLLRHEILNAITAIRGYADIMGKDEARARSVIESRSDEIQRTIEEVKYLTEQSGRTDEPTGRVDLATCLAESIERVRDQYPAASVTEPTVPDDLAVRANDRLAIVFTHLLENAAGHTTDNPEIDVTVEASETSISVSIHDDGPGLPGSQRRLLETGEIERFDDPSTGFGLNIVRLLVESFRGTIDTAVEDGTTITVTLPRADTDRFDLQPSAESLAGFRPNLSHLLVTLGAALVAGLTYGAASEALGNSIAGIGVFYGTASPIVGWLTHEFHSVVFGFVFAGLLSLAPRRYRNWLPAYLVLGLGWGLVLWTVAAGVIAPIWLQLLGIPVNLPNLDGVLLVAHIVWGLTIGLLTAVGYDRITPKLAGWLDA